MEAGETPSLILTPPRVSVRVTLADDEPSPVDVLGTQPPCLKSCCRPVPSLMMLTLSSSQPEWASELCRSQKEKHMHLSVSKKSEECRKVRL
jgi:hypothetical protein